MSGVLKIAERAARAAATQAMADEPAAKGMKASVSVRLYRERPKEFYHFERDVVQLFLLRSSFCSMSNADLAEHMSGRYEGYRVSPSAFYVPLKPWAKKHVAGLLSQFGVRLDLAGKITLSQIKRAIGGASPAGQSCREYNASFRFFDDRVVVNGQAFNVTTTARGYRRIRVGTQWLPTSTLETLLRRGTPS